MLIAIPDHVTLTLTEKGQSMIANGLPVDKISVGISTDEPSSTDATLQKEVADFPAYSSIENGKTITHTAIEYGAMLGIHEMGLYVGNTLVATINKELNRVNNQAILLVKYKRVYLITIEIDNQTQAVSIRADEREDLTYAIALTLQKVQVGSGIVKPTRIGQVLTSKVVNSQLVAVWEDLENVPIVSNEFPPAGNGDSDTIEIFTQLNNARYVANSLHNTNNYLEPINTGMSTYGGELNANFIVFKFKFNANNNRMVFNTSTGADLIIANNFDGTLTITDMRHDGEFILENLPFDENTVFIIQGNYNADITLTKLNADVYEEILPWVATDYNRWVTGITISGSSPTNFYALPPGE